MGWGAGLRQRMVNTLGGRRGAQRISIRKQEVPLMCQALICLGGHLALALLVHWDMARFILPFEP